MAQWSPRRRMERVPPADSHLPPLPPPPPSPFPSRRQSVLADDGSCSVLGEGPVRRRRPTAPQAGPGFPARLRAVRSVPQSPEMFRRRSRGRPTAAHPVPGSDPRARSARPPAGEPRSRPAGSPPARCQRAPPAARPARLRPVQADRAATALRPPASVRAAARPPLPRRAPLATRTAPRVPAAVAPGSSGATSATSVSWTAGTADSTGVARSASIRSGRRAGKLSSVNVSWLVWAFRCSGRPAARRPRERSCGRRQETAMPTTQ